MSDLNDLNKPVTTDTEPNVLDTLRGHIVRAATWSWSTTANKVAGLMYAAAGAATGGRSLRLYRRNDANTADEEVVYLPGMSVGGNAATASAAKTDSELATSLAAKVAKTSTNRPGVTKLYRNEEDSAHNIQTTWSVDKTGYWSLRGYDGDTYHAPVYVGYAGYADTAGSAPASDVYTWAKQVAKPSYSWGEIGGRPTALSSFTNDSGYQTSSGSVSYATSAGSAGSATTATTATALSTASGSAPSYAARAWVNFNGTGTVAIRASGNVSSITDNGTGDFTVNFSTAMPDANYSVAASGRPTADQWQALHPKYSGLYSTSQVTLRAVANGSGNDPDVVSVHIIR